MTQPVFETTATALREKSKLQRHFRRFDVFFYLIFYPLGGKTRRETSAERVVPAYVPADHHEPAS